MDAKISGISCKVRNFEILLEIFVFTFETQQNILSIIKLFLNFLHKSQNILKPFLSTSKPSTLSSFHHSNPFKLMDAENRRVNLFREINKDYAFLLIDFLVRRCREGAKVKGEEKTNLRR